MPLKRINKQKTVFNPKKIVNRVYGDSASDSKFFLWAPTVKALQYLTNSDTAVSDRIKMLENLNKKYDLNNITPEDIKYFKSLPKKEQKQILLARNIDFVKQHEDAKRIYFGEQPLYGTMEISKEKPTIGKSDITYQVNNLLNDVEFDNLIVPLWAQWKTGSTEYTLNKGFPWPGKKIRIPRVENLGKTALIREVPYLSNATLSKGRDEKGDYLSLYDVWDYNTNYAGTSGDNVSKWTGGKPFEIYQRYYLDDWFDIPEENRGNPWIAPSIITAKRIK